MRGGLGGFETAALVDGDVDEHGTVLHLLQHGAGDQLGSGSARDQHGTDDDIGFLDGLFQRSLGGVGGLHGAGELLVQLGQALVGAVEDGDVGAGTDGHLGGMGAGDTAADDHHLGRQHAGHAAQHQAAAALGLHQAMRRHGDRHAPGNLAHRRQQGQAAIIVGDGLIGDRQAARLAQAFRLHRIGGEVEIGVERVVRFQHRRFRRLGFLHLHDQLAVLEDGGRVRQDFRAGRFVHGVGKTDAVTGCGLDENLVTQAGEFGNAVRRQTDPVFTDLDFLGDPDTHDCFPFG